MVFRPIRQTSSDTGLYFGNTMQTIEFAGVTKIILSGGTKLTLIDNLTFKIHRGGIWNIVGPSGSGKSTILRFINRLEDPTKGTILLDSKNITTIPVRILRQKIAMVFQESTLLGLTVRENLQIPSELLRKKKDDDVFLTRSLENVGLDAGFLERYDFELSGGQKQRVAIARALLFEPEVLLLDEPTSALDKTLSENLLDLIKRLQDTNGMTVIHVTHDLEYVKKMGGTIIFIVGGKLIEINTTEKFLTHPENEITEKFISGTLQKAEIDEFLSKYHN